MGQWNVFWDTQYIVVCYKRVLGNCTLKNSEKARPNSIFSTEKFCILKILTQNLRPYDDEVSVGRDQMVVFSIVERKLQGVSVGRC